MYNDDAFATMLLTIPLSADRAEYARPLSTAEYAACSPASSPAPPAAWARFCAWTSAA